MNLELENKVAIITGGSEGIGRATAQSMVQEGARVVIVARRQEVLEQAAHAIDPRGDGVVLPVVGDVALPDTAAYVIKVTREQFGGVDILVNNAGMAMAKPFEDATESDWAADFELKVWGAIRLIRGAVPEMRQRGGGRIINVTANSGKAPRPSSMPTSIARAAGIALTKGLSHDLAKDNILVNTVCIGLIKSAQISGRYEQAKTDNPHLTLADFYASLIEKRTIPLGRVGETEEAADVITFLASSRASYITGAAINIDGGSSPVI